MSNFGSKQWRATAQPRKESRWYDDTIQFPRLIVEILATQDKLDVEALCAAMDITRDELDELFQRAQRAWDRLSYEHTKGNQPQ